MVSLKSLCISDLAYMFTIVIELLDASGQILSLDLKGLSLCSGAILSVGWLHSLRHNACDRKPVLGCIICVFLSTCHPGPAKLLPVQTYLLAGDPAQTDLPESWPHTHWIPGGNDPPTELVDLPSCDFFLDLNLKHFTLSENDPTPQGSTF